MIKLKFIVDNSYDFSNLVILCEQNTIYFLFVRISVFSFLSVYFILYMTTLSLPILLLTAFLNNLFSNISTA